MYVNNVFFLCYLKSKVCRTNIHFGIVYTEHLLGGQECTIIILKYINCTFECNNKSSLSIKKNSYADIYTINFADVFFSGTSIFTTYLQYHLNLLFLMRELRPG